MAQFERYEQGTGRLLEVKSLPDVPATAADVRAEAQRRIIAATGASSFEACITKQLNALMRATELSRKATLSEAETAEAAALQALADTIKAIRAASNVMEPDPPATVDLVAADPRWPA